MKPILVTDGIYELSINVEDILFESMWEIPSGVAVNSYIVKGEKTAIIDGLCGWDGVPETLFKLLENLNIEPKDIDYVVVNHMEPDHSGWIENFKKLQPDFKVVCTKFAADLFDSYYGNTENMMIVKEGDTLDLGAGRILSFHDVPNVHWPETMMTFDTLSKTLFSCDLFGTFGKLTNTHTDDSLSDEDYKWLEIEGLRYYSNVLATFSAQVKKAVDKTAALPVKIIAPGHGLVWRNAPETVVEMYRRFAGYSMGYGKKKDVLILWGSMYGMTEKAVVFAGKYLVQRGIAVHSHRVPETSWGQVLTSALASAAVIIATPTYEYKMFPPVAAALEEIGRKRLKKRLAFNFGSYGWSGGASKEMDEILKHYGMQWEFVEGAEYKGMPSDESYNKIEVGLAELIRRIEALDSEE